MTSADNSGGTIMRTGVSGDHWPALDGLRAIAVIGVVLFHVDRLPGGFLGVDLFFTLSGFLITTLLVREHREHGRIALGRFWARRFRRLLPAVMLLIGAVLAWLAVWGTPAEQATSRSDATWALPYLANWHLVAVARDYWASATSSSAFTHLWSLAIEEQFYVLWPIVVVLFVRRPGRLALVTGIGAAASGLALVVLAMTNGATRAYMGTDTRAAALLLGALVALPPVRERVERGVAARPDVADRVLVVAAGGLGALWWIGGRSLDVLLRGGLIVHSVLAATVVALLVVPTASPLRSRAVGVLSTRWLRWVGTMSYGIYLWHWPLIQLGRPRLDGLPDVVRDALLVGLAVVLSAISYHLVEHPVRRQRAWAAGRRAGLATVGLTIVAVTVVVVAPDGRGSVATFDPGSITSPTAGRVDAPAPTSVAVPSISAPTTTAAATETRATDSTTAAPPNGGATGVSTIAPTAAAPTFTAPRRPVERILWIGDSVAADAAPAIGAAFAAVGVVVVDGSFAARRLVSSDGVDAEKLYPPIIADARADVVVVQLSIWDSDHPVDVQRAAFEWFRDVVRFADADLVVVPHPPTPPAPSPGLASQIRIVEELVAADPDRVMLLDPTPLWGTEVDVDLDDDRVPDRKWDGVHLCPQGAARYATWLVDEVSQRYDLPPADPAAWLTGPWTTHPTYDTPVGSCALLAD